MLIISLEIMKPIDERETCDTKGVLQWDEVTVKCN